MVEYQQFFGGDAGPVGTFGSGTSTIPKVILDDSNDYAIDSISITTKYHLYNSLQAYFANGGGPCYIVSVGTYNYALANPAIKTALEGGIDAIETEDEVTLIVIPDAVVLNETNLGDLQKKILTQCNKLQDRFGVFDLKENAAGNDVGETNFRDKIGTQYLKYGAAYGPWLETSFSYDIQFSDLQIEIKSAGGIYNDTMFDEDIVDSINDAMDDLGDIEALIEVDYLSLYDGEDSDDKPDLSTKVTHIKTLVTAMRDFTQSDATGLKNLDIVPSVIKKVNATSDLASIIQKAKSHDKSYPGGELGVFADSDFDGSDVDPLPIGYLEAVFDFDLGSVVASDGSIYGPGSTDAEYVASATPFFRKILVDALAVLDEIKTEAERVIALLETSLVATDPIYANIKRAIAAKGIVIPSSGAVVGVYAATDANRGVWKAPANVSLANVVRPTIKVDNQTQESLNVHPTGKSINIIRSFTGKGVLIWGARTLAGNDNEWRYVPVRRLFNTAEESIKKATEFVVFEPNDANTWLRTRTMIENYLTGLWRQGALAGAKPSDAFFVNVGLGETMTSQDILEGRMIVEIGLAAVRPAEFIIIRFSHKLQES